MNNRRKRLLKLFRRIILPIAIAAPRSRDATMIEQSRRNPTKLPITENILISDAPIIRHRYKVKQRITGMAIPNSQGMIP